MHRSAGVRGWGVGAAALVLTMVFSALAFGAPTGVHAAACATPSGPNQVRCTAWVRSDATPRGLRPSRYFSSSPQGYGPPQLQFAYGLSKFTPSLGTTQTVAVVDAYNYTHLASDLAKYRSYYHLPSCTTASGCLRVVGETGTAQLPRYTSPGQGWNLETALDVDTVSAICPNCHILVVLANSASYADLGTAENTAATLGANVINNSWGGTDSSSDTTFDAMYFNHPGVAITAATGDSGYAAGPIYPSTSPNVVAVGGTSLDASRNSPETVWSGGGSGCSAYETTFVPISFSGPSAACGTKRAVADVAADADPNTGVAVYDTAGYFGWFPGMVGGTSVATQIIGGVIGLAGNAPVAPVSLYTNYKPSNFFDITSGINGTCVPILQCTAQQGWDGPTGLGSPNGIGGF